MVKNTRVGFTIGDGFRLGLGFIVAQLLFAAIAGIAWFMFAAALLGIAAVGSSG